MVAYYIEALPMIKLLKSLYPDNTQPWYSYDSGVLCTFDNIGLYFNLLKLFGQGREYYPKPLKSVLIMHPNNLTAKKYFGLRHGFKVFVGVRYLGGFIGYGKSKRECLKYQTLTWEKTFVR